MDTIFLSVANYPQFILNQYKEVDQKPAHTPTPQNPIISDDIHSQLGSIFYIHSLLLTYLNMYALATKYAPTSI